MADNAYIELGAFDEALTALPHTKTSAALYKLLSTIRKGVEWPVHKRNIIKLSKSGCFKQIVGALHSSHQHLIGVSLSILGNICMDESSTNEIIFKNNGLSKLNDLLKRFPENDSVVGRVFRIVGNMAQFNADNIIEMKPQLLSFTIEFLLKYSNDDNDSSFSEATVIMSLRVCRHLLNGRTFMQVMEKFGALKAIGNLLIKCSNRWTLEKKDRIILDNIIKFLLHSSKYKYYPGIADMRNTPRGDSLIHLSQLLPLAPMKIVTIIMNFIRICQLKSDLPIPEICNAFIKLLSANSIGQDLKEEYREYIKCLCLLLDHPANRSNDRCNDLIPQLIRVLDELKNTSEKFMNTCILITEALDKCSFHDSVIKEQLRCNSVGVLVNKMEWLMSSSSIICKHKFQKKRKKESMKDYYVSRKKSGMMSELREPRSPISSDDEMNRTFKQCYSSSSESEMASSPWSSPCSSPGSSKTHYTSDSEDYSPVCSDNEEKNDISTNNNEEDQNTLEIGKLSDSDDRSSEENSSPSIVSLKERLLTQILKLLKTYSVIQPTPNELCSEPLLLALLKSSNYFEQNSVTTELSVTLICRILGNHDHLLPLMQTDFIPAMYSFMITPHGSCCVKCNQIKEIGNKIIVNLCNLAESGRGKGDIANRLICGSGDAKKQLVWAIPYVIRNRSILNTLMLNCGGLDILMELLLDAKVQKKNIPLACALAAKTLGICSPQQWVGIRRKKMVIGDYQMSDSCTNVVTFILDDNSCVTADRDFLCEKSCYFNSLLNGDFIESNQSSVKLQHTDFKALKVLFRLLYCDFDKTEPKDVQVETSTLLNVIMLCDRYLLEDLCVFLTECVQQFAMSAENIPMIYKWSIESKTNILRVESIAYVLVGDVDETTRIAMFNNLFNLGCNEYIVDDIQKLLVRYLTLRDLH